jgi:hypothetical protein
MAKLQKDPLMILLESMDNKMQITVEAVCSLSDKIDDVEARLNDRIDNVERIQNMTIQAVASLDKKLSTQIAEVDKRLSAQINTLDKKVDAVHEELIAHRNDTELHQQHAKRSLKSIK